LISITMPNCTGFHPELLADRQKNPVCRSGSSPPMSRNVPRNEQEQVDEEEDHPRLVDTVPSALARQVGDAVQADQIPERCGNAISSRMIPVVLTAFAEALRKFSHDSCGGRASSSARVNHGHRRRFGGGEHAGQDPVMMITTTKSPGHTNAMNDQNTTSQPGNFPPIAALDGRPRRCDAGEQGRRGGGERRPESVPAAAGGQNQKKKRK